MLFRCYTKKVFIMVRREQCYLITHSLKNINQEIATAVILFRCNARKVFITIRRKVLFIHSFVEKYISGDSNSSYVISMFYKKSVYNDKRKVLFIHSFIHLLKNIYQEIATAVMPFLWYTRKVFITIWREKCDSFIHMLKNIYQEIAKAVKQFQRYTKKCLLRSERKVLSIQTFVEKYISGESNISYAILMLYKKSVYYD